MIIILFFKCQNPPYALLLQHALFVSGPTRSECSRPSLQVRAEPELKVRQPTADLSNSDTVKYKDIFRGGDWLIHHCMGSFGKGLNRKYIHLFVKVTHCSFSHKSGDVHDFYLFFF